jgi:hypothetical protein
MPKLMAVNPWIETVQFIELDWAGKGLCDKVKDVRVEMSRSFEKAQHFMG